MHAMDKKYEYFINKFIPSADMREKIFETEHVFSDFEMASIIWNSDTVLSDKHAELFKIATFTEDTLLRDQIKERITYDMDALGAFEKNSDGFVYILDVHEYKDEESIHGYFKKSKLAYDEGLLCGSGFAITKHQFIDEGDERVKGRIHISPLLRPKEEEQIDEVCFVDGIIAGIDYDIKGNVKSYYSYELPKERALKVESKSGKRFENRFVSFPDIYEKNEKIRIKREGNDIDETTGWIRGSSLNVKKNKYNAESEEVIDYSDSSLIIDFWDEDILEWDHYHVVPIYIERVKEELCNCFDENHQVIIGHDMGAAVWIRAVDIWAAEKIMPENVFEIGMEISINKGFYERVLRPFFIKIFDPAMTENKNRYSYAFSDEGCFLAGFEEDCLENNFFTYDQIKKILELVEETIGDIKERVDRGIDGEDIIQMSTFVSFMRRIMDENQEQSLITVMS